MLKKYWRILLLTLTACCLTAAGMYFWMTQQVDTAVSLHSLQQAYIRSGIISLLMGTVLIVGIFILHNVLGKKPTHRQRHDHNPPSLVSRLLLWVLLPVILCSAGVGIVGYQSYTAYTQMLLTETGYYPGISVDGYSLSAYDTSLDAQSAVFSPIHSQLDSIQWSVMVDDAQIVFHAADFGYASDAEHVLDTAYQWGRIGSDAERLDAILSLRVQPKSYATSITYDPVLLEQHIPDITRLVTDLPVDATMMFDPNAEEPFLFTPEKSGRHLDATSVAQQMKARCDAMDFTDLYFQTQLIEPEITVEQLKQQVVLLSETTTVPNDNLDRTHNIELAGNSVEGIIQPDEVFSFNGITGERTASLGYRAAPAIADGSELVETIAGGICQVSSTIYSAILPTDIEIVERYNHSLRVSYVPMGEDSTVDYYTGKDLKFRNTTGAPLYITCTMDWDEYEFTVRVYGVAPAADTEVKIRTEVIKSLGSSTSSSFSAAVPTGTTIVVRKASSGKVTETYRDYYVNGELVDSQLISTDTYNPVHGKVIYGCG